MCWQPEDFCTIERAKGTLKGVGCLIIAPLNILGLLLLAVTVSGSQILLPLKTLFLSSMRRG